MITSTPLSSRLVLGAALLVAACGDRQSTDVDSGVIRLLPGPSVVRDDRFLTWPGVVTVGGVTRPVLSASKPVVPPSTVTAPPGEQPRIGAQIPPELRGVPWLVFETVTKTGTTTRRLRSWPVTGGVAGQSYVVGLDKQRLGPDSVPAIVLWPVPDLATRDVETAEVRVPPHSVLQVSVALEEACWPMAVIPIDMTITALTAQGETKLHEVRIDVRRREDQQWLDLNVDLAALAGQSVRFKLSARPMAGPSASPALPVWADPTIVVQAAPG